MRSNFRHYTSNYGISHYPNIKKQTFLNLKSSIPRRAKQPDFRKIKLTKSLFTVSFKRPKCNSALTWDLKFFVSRAANPSGLLPAILTKNTSLRFPFPRRKHKYSPNPSFSTWWVYHTHNSCRLAWNARGHLQHHRGR